MTIEAEVGALSGLFQAVSGDLKRCNSSLDLVANRAAKLANQLNLTAECLIQFADGVQVISDAASNAKGSTRDIGAELTRFCLRQRALEADVRNWSSSLLQFATPLEKRGAEWKTRLGEIERRHRKNLKKSSKKQLSPEMANEHRLGCSEILLEQRNQFASFANQLLPVIKAQVQLLEEGMHVKSVEQSLESHLTTNEPQLIINAVLEDVVDRTGESWQKRLKSPSKTSTWSSVKRSGSSSSPSSSSVALSWGRGDGGNSIYGTISSVSSTARPTASINSADSGRRLPLSAQTFVPPDSAISTHDFGKPPLPTRGVTQNGSRSQAPFSHSTADVPESFRRPGRPLSFSGESEAPIDALKADSASLTDTISQLVDKLNDEIHFFCDDPPAGNSHSTICVRQSEGHLPLTAARPISIRPPPPQRRNSTITAATPTAPSIVDLRNAGLHDRQPHGYAQGPPAAFNNNSAVYASARDFGQRPTSLNQHHPSEFMYGNYAANSGVNGRHDESADPLPDPPPSLVRTAYLPQATSTYNEQPAQYETNVIYRHHQP